jgi:hypothetical protein
MSDLLLSYNESTSRIANMNFIILYIYTDDANSANYNAINFYRKYFFVKITLFFMCIYSYL